MSIKIESLDTISTGTAKIPEVLGLDLDEESEKTVILYLADKYTDCIGSEHTLTHTQLHVCRLFFSRKEKRNGRMKDEEKKNGKEEKKTSIEEKKDSKGKNEEKKDDSNDDKEEDYQLEANSELEGKIPISTSWAGGYSTEEAAYGLEKCVQWMKHYNGVSIPCWDGKLPRKPKLEEYWKDHTLAEDGKTPWCVQWIRDIHAEGVACDTVYQVLMCANYLDINSLIRLACCFIASIMKGKKFVDLPALIGGGRKKNPPSIEELMKDDHFGSMKSWDWTYMSKHLLNMQGVHARPDRPWNWDALSENPRVTMKDVLAFPDKPWNWSRLSKNGNITMKEVNENINLPWDRNYLSERASMDDVKAHPNKAWNWHKLCRNTLMCHSKSILEYVAEYPTKPWDWDVISEGPFISMKIVDEHPNLHWSWYGLSRNPSITMKDAEEHPDKPWIWELIRQRLNIPTPVPSTSEMFAKLNSTGFIPA